MNTGLSMKPQLHVSMLTMLAKCGIQFQRRYGKRFGIWDREEIIPPGVALVTGIAVHKTVEENMKAKINTGELLPVAQVEQIGRDSVSEQWCQGVLLTEDEAFQEAATKGATIDQTVALARLHAEGLAPYVNPAAVESRFVIEMNDYPFDLSGTKDLVEHNRVIRDTKTMSKSPSEDDAKSIQMAMYAVDSKVQGGAYPPLVAIDALVKNKTPKLVTVTARPEAFWIDPLFRRIERFAEIVDAVKSGKQALTPADPMSWVCSSRYCGWATTCPFWSGRE